MTGGPAASNDSTLAPRRGPEISPARTGRIGAGPTNPVHRSVPPENEPRITPDDPVPSSLYTHRKPSGGNGEPVEPTPFRADRSCSAAGRMPAFMQDSRYGAPVPA